MKLLFVLPAVLLLSFFGCRPSDAQKNIPVLKSNNKKLIVFFNNDTSRVNWDKLSQLEVYSTSVECVNEQNSMTFISDIDTISFDIKPNDTIQFYLLFNTNDKALVEIVGIPKNVNFSDDYIREHNGKISIEIPEVHELVNILIAISKTGQRDRYLVNKKTSYYNEVLKHFLSYSDHPIIDTINHNITDKGTKSLSYYYALKMNACGYMFDADGRIVNKGIIRKMGFNGNRDPLVTNAGLMQDFANKSNFRAFYNNHKSFYDSLIVVYKQLNPINKMKSWLEKKFQFEYGNYTVLFSPLVGGSHSTRRFSDNGFQQTFMFVSGAGNNPEYSANENEMRASRVVFTEIDHNFVNPVSDKKIDAINKAFSDRSKWSSEDIDDSGYKSAYSVFNEYMTWSLFSLYCLDSFPTEDAMQFIPTMEHQMVYGRKFSKFKEFNQQMIMLYRGNPRISINDLYDKILKWCMEQ